MQLDELGRRRMVPDRFSFPGPNGQPIIDARSETAAVAGRSMGTRCLVPADGFYEWQGGRGERQPLWFHDPAVRLLAFAGLAFERAGQPASPPS